jgi:hypothetical protein
MPIISFSEPIQSTKTNIEQNAFHYTKTFRTVEPAYQTTCHINKIKYNRFYKYSSLKSRISIKFLPNISSKLHKRDNIQSNDLTQLRIIEKEFNIAIKPVHARTDDPLLTPYFVSDVVDISIAKEIIKRLISSGMVESAYIKPDDAMPSTSI